MKKIASLLAVLSLLALSQLLQSAAVQASTVLISESSYVQITNYSAWYLYTNFEDPYGPPVLHEWNGFMAIYAPYYKSIPTIETKLMEDGLLFDCHSGYATVGDYSSAMPVGLCGMEPWKRVEFDWASNISSSAAPYLCIEVAGPSGTTYDEHVQWYLRPGAGSRSGHAIIDISYPGITDVVYIRLAVEPVPEPSSLLALTVFTVGFVCRRRPTR